MTEQTKELELKIQEVRHNYNNQSSYFDQLAAVVPSSQAALQVIERLETAAQGLDVVVEVTRIDEGVPFKSLAEAELSVEDNVGVRREQLAASSGGAKSSILPLYITLTVTGFPVALVEYIDAIEHVQELTVVQKFSISPIVGRVNQAEQEEDDWQLLLTAVFYLQDDGPKE